MLGLIYTSPGMSSQEIARFLGIPGDSNFIETLGDLLADRQIMTYGDSRYYGVIGAVRV